MPSCCVCCRKVVSIYVATDLQFIHKNSNNFYHSLMVGFLSVVVHNTLAYQNDLDIDYEDLLREFSMESNFDTFKIISLADFDDSLFSDYDNNESDYNYLYDLVLQKLYYDDTIGKYFHYPYIETRINIQALNTINRYVYSSSDNSSKVFNINEDFGFRVIHWSKDLLFRTEDNFTSFATVSGIEKRDSENNTIFLFELDYTPYNQIIIDYAKLRR